jgi:hypothetical protein
MPFNPSRLIVTLSSIPPRFQELSPTLESILGQRSPADEIILYIPASYRRFAGWDGCLPSVPAGVSIRRTDIDYGPATKILPAVREFAGQNVDILFCDDDRSYDPDWTKRFLELRPLKPGLCLAEGGKDLEDLKEAGRDPARMPRVKLRIGTLKGRLETAFRSKKRPISRFSASGYCDVFLGSKGVLVRPEFFARSVFDIPENLWTVDDFWLSGHLETRDIGIWINGNAPFLWEREIGAVSPLRTFVANGHDRDAANDACVEYYRRTCGIWRS